MANYTIVSFCGGGIRGLMSALILQRLATSQSSILNGTSLFAGTSTGSGIISLLLASKSPADIVDYFIQKEIPFFKSQGKSPNSPAYSIDEVAAGQALIHDGNPKLASFSQQFLLTAFNVGAAKKPWSPILFSNLPKSSNSSTGIVDAVTSSSAMPGMLGSWQGNIDGAFVNHDPTIPAIAAAISNGIAIEDIAVICIGTGFMPNWIASDTATWGAYQWQNGDGNPANNTPKLLVNGSDAPILNASLDGTSTNLMPMLSSMMLPGRYVNINPTLPFYIPENATSDADIKALKDAAAEANIAPAVSLLTTYWPASAGASAKRTVKESSLQ